MATIHVDGKDYEVDGSDNLLSACLSLGLDIPYFCWHPALGSAGACRQCAVKQYQCPDDTRGRLVMCCMTPASDGTYISIEDEEARAFRKSVIEWLMVNHPHDCPVCPEGGNCHLQDMTVMSGHSRREYRFTKRTHKNQDLGPFIEHEMNRCIACYRCVRFYQDYADGDDLNVFGAHDNVYFGRQEDGPFENEFSGNLVEVCPTGVFTDKTHNHRYNRKWDMQYAPSICQGCSLGCNISPGERYGELRRIENRYNGEVNRYFLCDRGRFGFGFNNRNDRPKLTLMNAGSDSEQQLESHNALASAAELLRNNNRVIGIGSPRASIESNYVLKQLVGADNYSTGMNSVDKQLVDHIRDIQQSTPAHIPSLFELEDRDAILILGEDLTQTAPRAALALRQAVKSKQVSLAAKKKLEAWRAAALISVAQEDRYPLFQTSFSRTRLDDAAAATYRAVADDQARLGFAVAHLIDADAPAVEGLDDTQNALAQDIANALLAADRPLVVSGTGSASQTVIDAAANIAQALHNKGKSPALSYAVPEANSLGVSLLDGMPVERALSAITNGDADALIVLENDLYRRTDSRLVDEALEHVKPVVINHQMNPTSQRAYFLLPTATFAEGDGTLINNEGRAQRFFQVYDPNYYDESIQVRESWSWLAALKQAIAQETITSAKFDKICAQCEADNPQLKGIVAAAPDSSSRIKGMKVARSPHRYSGRTAQRAAVNVHEPRVTQDKDSALAFSMEGYAGDERPGSMIPFAWAPKWNSPQAWNKLQDKVGGKLRGGDPGVRLFDAQDVTDAKGYFTEVPTAFTPDDKLLALPLHHIFGSDELSARSEAMQPQLVKPYISINQADAERLGLSQDDKVDIVSLEWQQLPLQIDPDLPTGTLGLPVGLTGQPWWTPNQRVNLDKGEA